MTLDDLWRLFRRYWAILLGCTLLGGALAGLYTVTRTKQYTASTTAYVVASDPSSNADSSGAAAQAYSNSVLAQQKAKSWVNLFTSSATAQRVIDQLHLQMSPSAVASSVHVTPVADAPQLNVSVTSDTPTKARAIADAVVVAAQKQVETLEGKGAGARINLVSNAVLPTAPSYPNPRNIIPPGLLAGLALGVGVTYLKARSDTRVRGQKDVEKSLATSVLAVIPRSSGLASNKREAEPNDFQTREAFRKLRTNLRFIDPDSPPRAIVVTSSLMGEGKSSVALNLARVLGASGEKVLLVDADLRRPVMASILDSDETVGLSQLIAGEVEIDDVITKTEHPNLWCITAGQIPPNPSELLGSRRMRSLIEALRDDYMVIFDAPPLLPVTDAAVLLPSTDGALLVVEAERARFEQLASTRRSIETVSGHLLGAVINRAKLPKGNKGKVDGTFGPYGAYGEYVQSPVADNEHVYVPADEQALETPVRPRHSRGEEASEQGRRATTSSQGTTTQSATGKTYEVPSRVRQRARRSSQD